MDNLDSIADHVRQGLSVIDASREKILPLCRDVIRHCSGAIRASHRREDVKAKELLRAARTLLDEVGRAVAECSELGSTGYVRDAQKEFAEGSAVVALIAGKPLPHPDELGVSYAAYLNGLAEAASELRRYLLDSMRQGDLSRGEELLTDMDDIYSVLVTMDFPDAVTGGLRHTTDMLRGVLERTRSDLTLAIRQKELEERIRGFEEASKGG